MLVVSHYADGTRFLDISDPENPIEVGYYDTSEIEGLYVGNWGTYVDLPSGNIISSDIESGLYVLKFGGVSILHEALDDQPAGLFDIEEERERLMQQITSANEGILRVEAKLNNQQFVDKAPEEVVQREKDRLSTERSRLENLERSLEELIGT